MANENKFGLRAKIAAIFSTIALFVLMYSACNTEKDVNDDTKDSERMVEAYEQNLMPTRVYDLVEITPDLFGKEAEKACKQNDKQFNPKYDRKNDVCHLTIKQPVIQTKRAIKEVLPQCVIDDKYVLLEHSKLTPYKKLSGLCRADSDWYKAEIFFKKPISIKQDIVNQCKKMDNCSCDKDGNCTLIVHDPVVTGNHRPLLGYRTRNYFNLDAVGGLVGPQEKISDNKHRITVNGDIVTIIYDNVEEIIKPEHKNCDFCKLSCAEKGKDFKICRTRKRNGYIISTNCQCDNKTR